MKVLLVNKFLFPKGGDAICTLSTGDMLKRKGHTVAYWGMEHPQNKNFSFSQHFISTVDFNQPLGFKKNTKAAINLLYSLEAKRKFEATIQLFKPDVVHLHNFAHQISPSLLHIIKKYHIPTVMTLHDYKLVCPIYTLLSGGNLCQKCQNSKYYWCFIKRCTKNSYPKSLLNTLEMILHHQILRIYDLIDIFISPSQFLKQKIKSMGFKGEIIHLPNFINLSHFTMSSNSDSNGLCYFGRLSPEKGLFTLLKAMKNRKTELKIIGDGPLKTLLEQYVKKDNMKNIKFLGYLYGKNLHKEISSSMAVVLPSEWYENNPLSIMEAFALGKPVIGSRIGGIPELVKDHITGLTFESGNIIDLREKMTILKKNPEKSTEMGKNAREYVGKNLNSEHIYKKLMPIYERSTEKSVKNKR